MDSAVSLRALHRDMVMTEHRLRAWADWARTGRLHLGFPRVSASGKMVEWKRLGIRPESGRPPPVSCPDAIAEVDHVIAKLPADQKLVLCVHLLYDHEPLEVRVRRSKLSSGTYRRRLDHARWSVKLGLELLADLPQAAAPECLGEGVDQRPGVPVEQPRKPPRINGRNIHADRPPATTAALAGD